MENNIQTYFDLPERRSIGEVLISREIIKSNILVNQILEGFPEAALILNMERQIVVCNSEALKLFRVETEEEVLGKRIGEAFNCIHSRDLDGGCGTSKFCKECGTGKGLKLRREERVSLEEECRIISQTLAGNRFLNLEIKIRPLVIDEVDFTLVSIIDIAAEKRRNELERIFFHDILNTGGAINGLSSLLLDEDDSEAKDEITKALVESSKQLINEIMSQKELSNAQDGNLEVNNEFIFANEIIKRSFDIYDQHMLAKGIILKYEYLEEDIKIYTDATLLVRSIGNLIKNALEASKEGQFVKIYAEDEMDDICFKVFNESIILDKVKLNIFQRSFSTKGTKGRGIGTYSVKLLIEDYLKGEVGFISDELNKTIFHIRLNKGFQ